MNEKHVVALGDVPSDERIVLGYWDNYMWPWDWASFDSRYGGTWHVWSQDQGKIDTALNYEPPDFWWELPEVSA